MRHSVEVVQSPDQPPKHLTGAAVNRRNHLEIVDSAYGYSDWVGRRPP